jgi:hypothetical protein
MAVTRSAAAIRLVILLFSVTRACRFQASETADFCASHALVGSAADETKKGKQKRR